jgi:transcriptional regulator with XRE-family HTH domain
MHEAFAAEFGQLLREARRRKGLRQGEVAEALHLSIPVYARMERGKLLPSVTVLRGLCVVLDVSSEALLQSASLRAETDASARDEVYALMRELLVRLGQLPDAQVQALAMELRAGLATLGGA